MQKTAKPEPLITSVFRKHVLPKVLQTVITILSLIVLSVTYIKWDNRKLQGEVARKIRLGDEGKGFREFASPVIADTSNFCAIPCLKDSSGGTGNEERDSIAKARVEDLFRRVKTATSGIHVTAVCEDPSTNIPPWADRLRDAVTPTVRDSVPPTSSKSALTVALLHRFIPELEQILGASDRPNAQWTPALRIRKFKGPVQFAESQQPSLSLGLSKLLGALSAVYLEENAPEQAIHCIKAILKIAAASFDEPLQISNLVAISVLRSAQDPIRLALSNQMTSIDQVGELLSSLQTIRAVESYARASWGEAAIGLEFIDSLDTRQFRKALEEQATTIPKSYHPLLFAFSGALIKNLSLRTLLSQITPEVPASGDDMPAHLRRVSEWQHETYSPLQSLTDKLFPAQTTRLSLARTVATAEAQLRLARLACSVEIHRRKNKALPTKLDELPLSALTINGDPFAAAPMHFQSMKPLSPTSSFRIWSVGLDFKDDNGELEQTKSPPRPNTPGGDIIWNSSTKN
jgi:hypothetical protein